MLIDLRMHPFMRRDLGIPWPELNRTPAIEIVARLEKKNMPKENDLEGAQDQGGKHGGQKGMPRPEPRPNTSQDQGVVRDERGQEQPRDKARVQQTSGHPSRTGSR
jgi:hypothetical protein